MVSSDDVLKQWKRQYMVSSDDFEKMKEVIYG